MISIFGVLFVVAFFGIFFVVLITIFSGFWKMRGMASKVLTLAEQEIERSLREGLAKPTAATEQIPDRDACLHCGSRVTAKMAQCPNCGAGVP
ncbi:MAG: hypothetical protein FD138_2575 [Planctomycetota bacterium]|nr:MAG: hypothetical protein FD138_2575 [Planctomycetota bacterium]